MGFKCALYNRIETTDCTDFAFIVLCYVNILRILTRHCWGPCLLGDIAFATGFDRLDMFNLFNSADLTSSELPTRNNTKK